MLNAQAGCLIEASLSDERLLPQLIVGRVAIFDIEVQLLDDPANLYTIRAGGELIECEPAGFLIDLLLLVHTST